MQGAGRLLLLPGEPGIGKTTLVGAHAAEAEARGALVLWGRCHETPGAPPYWPWLQVLEALARPVAELSDGSVEELAALRDNLRAEGARESPETIGAHTRFELFARVARALSRVAEKQGLVVVVDDLHWADVASLGLLRFLASEVSADAILMVATIRAHEPESEATLESLARLARTVPVGPLTRPAVRDLLAERMPVLDRADAEAPAPGNDREALVGEVWDRSEGNPFFVLELAQLLLLESTDGGRPRTPLSFGVKKVLERRLDPLPDATRRLLAAASVVGREFDLRLLAHVTGEDPAALREALRPAVELGLLHARADARDRFAFAHALTRETLYEALSPEEAAQLHGRVAIALEEDGRDEHLPALAHHFFAASAEETADKAADYGFEAGRQMLRSSAYEQAAVQFERVLSLLRDGDDAERGVEARLGLGQALLGAGDRPRAESVCRDAMEQAQATGDPRLYGTSVLAWCSAREEIGVIDREGNARLESALERLPEEASPLRARLLARLSSGLHLEPGAEARRQELADAALRLAKSIGDPATTSFVRIRWLAGLMGPDHLEERLAATATMMAEAAGEPNGELNALSFRLDAFAERGDRVGLDGALSAFEEKAANARHPVHRWNAECFRTAMALAEGRYGDAETHAVTALKLGQRAQDRTPMLQFAQQMFMARAWQNRVDEIAPLVEGGVETTRVVPAWHCALADLYHLLGRTADSRREFDAVARDDFASVPRDTTWLTSMVLLASVCARNQDVANARKLYALLRPYTGRIATGSPLVVMVGQVDTRLGQLAGVLGRYDEAEAHFDDALAVAERMRALPWQAEIRYCRASVLHARGLPADAERAAVLLDEALAIARPVGMALLVTWIEAFRERADAGTSRPAPLSRPASFQREGDLWTITFEGRTTRLRPMVGLTHLHRLLAAPGHEIRALDLVAAEHGRGAGAPDGDAGPVLDERARRDYQQRVRDLREELEDAEERNDRGRAEQLSHELELVTAELVRGFGLGGRPRSAGSTAERARVSVTRAIRYAIRKIGESDEGLAQHLQRDVRTGAYCVYDPSDRDRVSWEL